MKLSEHVLVFFLYEIRDWFVVDCMGVMEHVLMQSIQPRASHTPNTTSLTSPQNTFTHIPFTEFTQRCIQPTLYKHDCIEWRRSNLSLLFSRVIPVPLKRIVDEISLFREVTMRASSTHALPSKSSSDTRDVPSYKRMRQKGPDPDLAA